MAFSWSGHPIPRSADAHDRRRSHPPSGHFDPGDENPDDPADSGSGVSVGFGQTEAAEHRHDLPLSAESGHLNGHRAAGAEPVAVIRCLRSVFETVVDLLAARRIWRVSCTARICADCPGPSQLW
jgi:hypothetical protein